MPLVWTQSTYDDATIYEANSAAVAGPRDDITLMWTIDRTPQGLYTLDMTDFELLPDEDAGLEFTTLAEAKAHCERREAELTRKETR